MNGGIIKRCTLKKKKGHIFVKWENIKCKEKALNTSQEKRHYYLQRSNTLVHMRLLKNKGRKECLQSPTGE